MNNERKFYKCSVCGNIVGLIEDGGGTLVCCGQEMDLLVPSSVDAAKEKHVPTAKRHIPAFPATISSSGRAEAL